MADKGNITRELATRTVAELLRRAGVGVRIADDREAAAILAGLHGGIRKMTAWHGSATSFDKFNWQGHAGEGEGSQVFGQGNYLSDQRSLSMKYARIAFMNSPERQADIDGRIVNWNDPKESTMAEYIACDYIERFGPEEAKKEIRARIELNEKARKTPNGWVFDKDADDLAAAQELIDGNRIRILQKSHHPLLYKVEIPDDTGTNYLSWDGMVSASEQKDIYGKLALYCDDMLKNRPGDLEYYKKSVRDEILSLGSKDVTGGELYKSVCLYVGEKEASKFLSGAGYVGMKVHASYFAGDPRYNTNWNYVVFNDDDIRIKEKIRLQQDSGGKLMGWQDGNSVVLTRDGINPETPIHEYTHLWARAMMVKNPEGWESVKALLRGTPVWNGVIKDKNYGNIRDDENEVASEALSRLSGVKNAAGLQNWIEENCKDASQGNPADKGVIDCIVEALRQFWSWVGKELFGIKGFKDIDEVTDRVMYDLVNGTDITLDTDDQRKDKLYERYVREGNTELAKRMLYNRAAAKGYMEQDYSGKGSWAAPTAEIDKEDFGNLEALRGMVDDYGVDSNIYGIINGVQCQSDYFYFHPDRSQDAADAETMHILDGLRKRKASPDTKINVYRTVPNDVKGRSLMAGDWIALSRHYCVSHGNHRYGEGNYHIIEGKVPIKYIWQDTFDSREFGYDDGLTDVEKNVPNNRKLLEITYDDKGKLIPLSERFNEQRRDIRYQVIGVKDARSLLRDTEDVDRNRKIDFGGGNMDKEIMGVAEDYGLYLETNEEKELDMEKGKGKDGGVIYVLMEDDVRQTVRNNLSKGKAAMEAELDGRYAAEIKNPDNIDMMTEDNPAGKYARALYDSPHWLVTGSTVSANVNAWRKLGENEVLALLKKRGFTATEFRDGLDTHSEAAAHLFKKNKERLFPEFLASEKRKIAARLGEGFSWHASDMGYHGDAVRYRYTDERYDADRAYSKAVTGLTVSGGELHIEVSDLEEKRVACDAQRNADKGLSDEEFLILPGNRYINPHELGESGKDDLYPEEWDGLRNSLLNAYIERLSGGHRTAGRERVAALPASTGGERRRVYVDGTGQDTTDDDDMDASMEGKKKEDLLSENGNGLDPDGDGVSNIIQDLVGDSNGEAEPEKRQDETRQHRHEESHLRR